MGRTWSERWFPSICFGLAGVEHGDSFRRLLFFAPLVFPGEVRSWRTKQGGIRRQEMAPVRGPGRAQVEVRTALNRRCCMAAQPRLAFRSLFSSSPSRPCACRVLFRFAANFRRVCAHGVFMLLLHAPRSSPSCSWDTLCSCMQLPPLLQALARVALVAGPIVGRAVVDAYKQAMISASCQNPAHARYTHLLAARRASFGSTAPSALTPCCCETDARHSAAVKAKSVNVKMSRDEAFKILDLEEKSADLNAIREVPWPLSPSPSFLPPAVTPPRFCNSF